MQSKTQGYAGSCSGRRQSADDGLPSGHRPVRREIQGLLFDNEPIQSHAYPVPDRVYREMGEIADRMGQRAREAITDLLWRECGETLGAHARNVIADEFLSERAEWQRAFLESLGLSPPSMASGCFGPGTWTLTQDWLSQGPFFVIDGVCGPTGDFVTVWLEARAFHRASSVLRAVTRAIGPGDYTMPSAYEWRRIWHGGRKGESGIMTKLLVSLRPSGEQDLWNDRKEKAP